MRALRKIRAEFGAMEIQNIPEPEMKPNYVKIKVAFAGICGSDMKFYHWTQRPGLNIPIPVTLGHEFSGAVVEVGEAVTNISVGDRVTSETPKYYCGKCEYCRTGHILLCKDKKSIGYQTDGAMAEYITVPQELVHHVPDNVALEDAALCEPASVAAHAVYDKADIGPGDMVVIFGPGPIGLLTLEHVLCCGAKAILVGLSKDAERLEIGKSLGASHIIYSDRDDVVEKVKELTGGRGADAAFECAGVGTVLNQAPRVLRRMGKLVIVSLFKPGEIPIDVWNNVVNYEIEIVGSYGQRYKNWEKVLELLSEEKLNFKPVISHIIDLENWEEAFGISERQEGLKILLKP